MNLEPVVEQIRSRMEQLHLRYVTIYPNHPMPSLGLTPAFAEEMAERLAHGDELSVEVLRAVVDPGDLLDESFWATPLGRLMFAAGGYKRGVMTQTAAAAVLGLSRQRVHQLILSEGLGSDTSVNPAARMVRVEDVRFLLKPRLDALVK
jgi:hypothetical protein